MNTTLVQNHVCHVSIFINLLLKILLNQLMDQLLVYQILLNPMYHTKYQEIKIHLYLHITKKIEFLLKLG